MSRRPVRCAIMRGGTSKAVVFSERDLPADPDLRERLILAAFGSPDPRQIDGLGGADPLTSKVAIVANSSRPDTDVDYTFGQVGIGSPVVNYAFGCGNTAAAVALYAVEERLVSPANGTTVVRIHCTNNGTRISAQVAAGASGTSVRLEFHDPAGGGTGQLLPSGQAINEIRTASGTHVRFSLVDCGNVYAIIPAGTWSLTGSEDPAELDHARRLRQEIEELREAITDRYLSGDERRSSAGRPATRLKVAIVGRPAASAHEADLVARIINPECVHKTFAVTGTMNLAAAAGIPGSVVTELLDRPHTSGREVFRIGHPKGVIAAEVVLDTAAGRPDIRSILIDRTARRIMDGFVYVPDDGQDAVP